MAKVVTFVLLMSTTTAALGAGTGFASPVAVDDTYSVVGSSVTLRPLANDYDTQSGGFRLGISNTSGSTAAGGTFSCSTTNVSCQYTPPTGYYGADSFSYSIGRRSGSGPNPPVSGGTSSATVHITVNANQPPTAVDDNVVMKGSAEAVFELTLNDTDPNLGDVGEELQIPRSSSTSTHGGTVECAEYWKLECRYTPSAGFVGVDGFTYTVIDSSGLTDTGSVEVTVNPNPNPVAVDDAVTVTASYANDRPYYDLDLVSNDTDPEGDVVYVSSFDPTIGAHGGQLTWTRYTPAIGFFGTESFEYTAMDPFGGSDTATVTITVLQDLPPVANDDSAQVRGAVDVVIPVTANDTDDFDTTDRLFVGSFDQTSVDGGAVTCDGYSTCTYRAADGFAGTDTFTYRTADHFGQLGNSATVTIEVLPNAAPVIGATATVHLRYPEKTYGILTGLTMTDADGDVLTAVGGTSANGIPVTCGPGGMSVSGPFPPSCIYRDVVDGALAADSVVLTVTDDHGAQTTRLVDLTLVLDSPIQVPDVGGSTAPNTPVRVAIVPVDDEYPGYNPGFGYESDTTPGGGALSCGSGPTATAPPGVSEYWCDYTPAPNFSGIDTFTYSMNDAWSTDTGVATISVSAGAAVAQPAPAGGTVSSDVDGDGATPSDPIEAAVQLGGNPGVVAIAERTTTTAAPPGYTLLGKEMDISAPDQTAASPLKLTFVIDASQVPIGTDVASLKLIRNGVPLQSCTGPAGTAAPDPCQQSATVLAGGDIQLVALSSHASVWAFGLRPGPTVSLPATPLTVAEGSSIQITATASGTGTLHYAWTPPARFDAPTAANPRFTGLDDGPATVGVTVTDDNGTASATTTVNVTNVAPTVAVVAPATASVGQSISVSGSFTDPGTADTHTATIAWGDGSTSNATVTGHAVAATSHTYTAAGSFTVTLKVTDDNSGIGTAIAGITVGSGAITLSTSDAQANEGTSSGSAGTLTFTVKLDRADPTKAHAINYMTVNGSALKSSDYTEKTGTLNFKKGETIKTVTVKTSPDNVDEANETMSLQLSLTGSGLDPSAAHDLVGTGTIVDDDQATLSAQNVTQSEANNGTTNVQVTLKMTPSATAVTVTYATVAGTAKAGTDFVALAGSVTFQPGQNSKTVTVQIVNDRVREPSEQFGLKFTGSAGVAGTPTAIITIRDND